MEARVMIKEKKGEWSEKEKEDEKEREREPSAVYILLRLFES